MKRRTNRTLLLLSVMAAAATGPILAENEQDGAINNVIDCAQYPADSADLYHEPFLDNCRQFAQSLGYRDAVLLPQETAADEVKLAGKPPTCPTIEAGNVGLYCVALDKQPR